MRNRVFRFALIILALALLSISVVNKVPAKTVQSGGLDLIVAQGIELYKAKQYKAAFEKFSQAEKSKTDSTLIQYYLGMSAMQTQNLVKGRDALAKVAVMTTLNDKMHKAAAAVLNQYVHCTAYSCLSSDMSVPGVVRWEKAALPLKIYISDGKQLPEIFTNKHVDPGQMKQIIAWSRSGELMQRLSIAPGYNSKYKQFVLDGLKRWDWASRESLIAYQLTDDHTEADVIVFWCKNLFYQGSHTYLNKDGPALVFLSTEVFDQNNLPASIAAFSSHEFGHAWGLEHSNNPNDVMYVRPEESRARACSESDKLTLRALYSIPAKLYLRSVKHLSKH